MNRVSFAAVTTLLITAGTAPASAMVRHVSIFQPPVSMEQFDPWYFTVHSQECIRYYGPWLTRYITFRSLPIPADMPASALNVYMGRYTELWYQSADAWREADPYRRTYSRAPWPGGGLAAADRPSASLLVAANPTDNFLGREPVPSAGPYIRLMTAVRFPKGVPVEEGDRWYREVHARELAKLPGLLRYVSSRAVPDSPLPSTWIRMDEMWFHSFDDWKKAMTGGAKYSAAPWAGTNGAGAIETISTFVALDPDKDFLK